MLFAALLPGQSQNAARQAPYVTTPPDVVEAMLKLADVKPGDVVFDLGCGDGRIVITAAARFQARGTGVDIDPERIKEARENARTAGVSDRVDFLQKDLFETDIHNASVVTLYLLPDLNLRLRPKLLQDLKPGTRIVSHSFDMGEWKPDKQVDIHSKSLYLWIVTEKAKRQFWGGHVPVEGIWLFSMSTAEEKTDGWLIFRTEQDRLTGSIFFADSAGIEIQDGTVLGNRIGFTARRNRPAGGAAAYRITGTVEGDRMQGQVSTEVDGRTTQANWTAVRK